MKCFGSRDPQKTHNSEPVGTHGSPRRPGMIPRPRRAACRSGLCVLWTVHWIHIVDVY